MTKMYGTNYNAPMVGSISNGEVTGLAYEGGLVRIELDGVKAATFQNDAKKIGAYYSFNPQNGTIELIEDEGGTLTVENIPADGVIYIPVVTSADKNNTEKVTMQLTSVTLESSDDAVDLTTPFDIEAQVAKGAMVESEDDGLAMVGSEVVEYQEISDFTAFAKCCS